jgi:hypothetical protein
MGAGYSPSPIRTGVSRPNKLISSDRMKFYRCGGAGAIAIADGSYARSRHLLRGDVCRVLHFRLGSKTEVAALRRDVCFAHVSGHRQAVSACPKSAKGLNRSRGRALRRAAWPWMDDGSVLPDDEGPEAYPQNR